jgi:hypothetical protein
MGGCFDCWTQFPSVILSVAKDLKKVSRDAVELWN